MGHVLENQMRVRLTLVLLSPLNVPERMNSIRNCPIQTLLTLGGQFQLRLHMH